MRDWQCYFRQRRLALLAGRQEFLSVHSALAKHVEACSHCRAYWEEIGQLAQQLPQMLHAPASSEGFQERLWAQLQAQPVLKAKRRSKTPYYTVGIAVTGIALVLWLQAGKTLSK